MGTPSQHTYHNNVPLSLQCSKKQRPNAFSGSPFMTGRQGARTRIGPPSRPPRPLYIGLWKLIEDCPKLVLFKLFRDTRKSPRREVVG